MTRASLFLIALCLLGSTAAGAAAQGSLRDVHKVFVEKMPNDLDQYITAEITKQLAGRVIVVVRQEDADGVIRGTSEMKTGVGAAITGRALGLHDTATGSIALVDKDERTIIWSGEAGDRNMWVGAMARSGPRKVADRLVHDLKKALDTATR